MKRYSILISLITIAGTISAQQIAPNNQYLVNRFSLSPAYAGYTGNFETFFGIRHDWKDIPGSSFTKTININSPVGRNMGLGGSIETESIGIFNSLNANLAYAYRLSFSEKQSITFGAYAGLFENHIGLSGTDAQLEMDPVIGMNQALGGAVFDAGAAVLYRYDHLNFGIAAFRLPGGSIDNKSQNESDIYSLSQHFRVHASYFYDITNDIRVEPYVVVTNTVTDPIFYEAAALIKYKKFVWLGASYRKNSIGVSLGATYSRFVMNYTYEFGSGIMAYSGGSHELSVGILIGKNKSTTSQPSVFRSETDQPYHQWAE
ncbi:MAG: PorP/SprF family type IX secretion system membrane protein [Bacteroidetes bacterium]|nr:PorP/SprF family type IX secretion system membrane protein [Bacteroidota bacterium]